MERVVKRSDLAADDDTASTSPEPELVDKIRVLGNFEYVTQAPGDNVTDNAEGSGDELDFRLFSSAKPDIEVNAEPEVAKIKLRSPSPENAEPGFIERIREPQYYFKAPPSEIEQEQFKTAAISGADVVRYSLCSWPGCSYSWKVLRLPISKHNQAVLHKVERTFQDIIGVAGPVKRRRLSKKARIKARIEREATKKRREEEQQTAEAKAIADREKRNRRNREKKIKRRARDRAKKAEAGSDSDELPQDPV